VGQRTVPAADYKPEALEQEDGDDAFNTRPRRNSTAMVGSIV
jgi:hypothetical protein